MMKYGFIQTSRQKRDCFGSVYLCSLFAERIYKIFA